MAEEEVEYESDPEEAQLSLKMRRREASDDEEDGDGEERVRREKPPRRIDSDGESDGQGAAAEYDDDEELEEEDEYEDEELLEEEEEEQLLEEEFEERGELGAGRAGSEVEGPAAAADGGTELDGDGGKSASEGTQAHQGMNDQVEEEKKVNEPPFAVPTAGAFYMHDDRFRDNAGGRHRRTLGGRKLWESKDDRKWGHDKFEEMTMQDRHYEEGRRSSRGHYRGRGKSRGADRGYPRGSRSKTYNNSISNNNNNSNNNNLTDNAAKAVRGRGPRRYQPSAKKNNQAPAAQNRQSGKSVEKVSYTSSGRASATASNLESDSVPTKKHVFASSLNSASPPFYPSGSSGKEIRLTPKRDPPSGTVNRNIQASAVDESFSVSQSNAVLRGKSVAGSIGMDKLYIDDSISSSVGKSSSNLQLPPAGSSSMNANQSLQPRSKGRGLTPLGQMTYQPLPVHNQVSRVSPPAQVSAIQRGPIQPRAQPSSQASGHQLGQLPGTGSQASSPPKASSSVNSYEPGEQDSPPESSKAKSTVVGKGKGSAQGSERGSFMYGGAQAMGTSGNMGSGDQNFPAFLPVMQFGGQHPGGIGVPALGMAFPGYVAQPQLGLGNSEMTWLPVLTGAAGALGATYCPPYLTMDGAYHARPSGQTPSLPAASSKDNSTNKSNAEWKPSQKPELASDEFGQRQNKPRRYTEMKFDQ